MYIQTMRKGSKMSSQEKKWLFKLEQDIDLGMPTAWSGFVRCDGSRADARRAIAKKMFMKRLPANTIVMSHEEIVAGIIKIDIKRKVKYKN